MTLKCYRRPNRKHPRRFKPSDITRIVGIMRSQGESEEIIRMAVNQSGLFVIDDTARPLLVRMANAVDQVEARVGGFRIVRGNLDTIFGNTDWNVPGWVLAAIRRIPVFGSRVAAMISMANALQRSVQEVKELLSVLEGVRDAVKASEELARDS